MNYQKILGYSLIPINLLGVIIIALNHLSMLPSFWNSLYVFYIAVLIDTLFFAIVIKNMLEHEREKSNINFYSKYFFHSFFGR